MGRTRNLSIVFSFLTGLPHHGLRRLGYFFHHWTWGSINGVVGALAGSVCVAFFPAHVFRWKDIVVVLLPLRPTSAATLGPIVLATGSPPAEMLEHERGHFLQSIALGPLYYLVIGIPSVLHLLWFQRFRRQAPRNSYYRFYTEAWADAWAGIRRAD